MELFRTERFVIRNFRLDDVAAHVANRNDETTAEFQSWSLPYPKEKAIESVNRFIALGKPAGDDWFGYVIADPTTDTLIGDIAVHLEWAGRSAEIGYSLTRETRGRGIGTDAVAFILQYLFDDIGVKRIHAALHPENFASMMVLERLGFIYEGTARQSYWVDDTCTDDPQFGLLRRDWETWNARARTRPSVVELHQITSANRNRVFGLESHRSQRRFVAPMAKSAAEALVPDPDDNGGVLSPWMTSVIADDEVVGFAMVAEQTPTFPHPMLWRLLIDRMHQRRGIGMQVLELLAQRYRAKGSEKLLVSWVPGRGSPEPLYLRFGFVPTGEPYGDEVLAALVL
jgi:RimJ/RimL family protein N-acetyltransferase/ribosomal protein S18 acetylase RimI-like enzyme